MSALSEAQMHGTAAEILRAMAEMDHRQLPWGTCGILLNDIAAMLDASAPLHAPDCPGRKGMRGHCDCANRPRAGREMIKVSPTNADGMIALAAAINNLASAHLTVGMRPR